MTNIDHGTANTTLVVRNGLVTQTWPPLSVGCACSLSMDPGGCVAEYVMPGVGAVVRLEAYTALRRRLWIWRLRNWWEIQQSVHQWHFWRARKARRFGRDPQ